MAMKKQISIALDEKLKAKLASYAKKKFRSISSMVNEACYEYLLTKGVKL